MSGPQTKTTNGENTDRVFNGWSADTWLKEIDAGFDFDLWTDELETNCG
jgi:hypothetical protein